MRSARLTVFLAVLLASLVGAPRLWAQALDPNDDFGDGVIDASKWVLDGDPKSAWQETDGHLTITMTPETSPMLNLQGVWWLRGPFDIQVDYSLLGWPAHSGAIVGLLLMSPDDRDWEWVQRVGGLVEAEGSDEVYLANVRCPEECFCEGVTPTSDTSGTLRATRDENSLFAAYYWSAADSQWVVLYQRTMPDTDVKARLTLWGPVTEPVTVAFDNFQVNRGELVPTGLTIEDVQIDRGRDTDWWDWARYHQRVTVQVKGTEYEQPVGLFIDDPEGSEFVIWNDDPSGCYVWAGPNEGGFAHAAVTIGPDYTYTYTWYEGRKPQSPLPGSYQLTVVGSNGSQLALTTPVAPEVPEEGPVLTGPAADSVIDSTLPTFEWLSLPGEESWIQLRAEGAVNYTGPVADDAAEIWRADISGKLAAVYNFYGSDPGPDLEPGRTYYWQVNSWSPVDDGVSDPRVSIWNEQTASHRFAIDTEWPALPDLPGRLVYTQVQYGDWSRDYDVRNVVQYGTSIHARQWIGPAASASPDISWDGTTLQYRIQDAGTWLDDLHGTRLRVPNQSSWNYTSLSPDATHILYVEGTAPNWTPDAWTQKIDGSDRRLLVAVRGFALSRPHWSPDGAWIAYTSCCDPSGYNVWLIRPDGTEDHAVVPTSVAGYPDWTITWFANGSQWSPDARRLVATFVAVSPDESDYINAFGIISREGGEVTPIWVNPCGSVCCAAAFPQMWSPDGASIVFSSGHHLAPDPDWASGKFEPGVELWMINADGSGEPTRLTYDYSYPESSAWWAPNTPVGKEVSVVKGEATLTFTQVAAKGSTRMNVTLDAPGPAPQGYAFASDLWSGATTAGYRGGITVALRYDAEVAGQEDSLALMEWRPEKAKWQDITAWPIDAANHIIRGRTGSLGVFAVCLKIR